MFNVMPAMRSAGGAISGIQFVNSAFVAVNGTSYTVDIPVGTQEGDLMIAFIHFNVHVGGGSAGTDSQIVTSPSGWLHFSGSPDTIVDGVSNADATTGLMYKVATASEPADYTWTKNGNGLGLWANRVAIATFRNTSPSLDFITLVGDESNHNDGDTIWNGTDSGASDLYLCGLHYGTNGYVDSGSTNLIPSDDGSPSPNPYTDILNYLYSTDQNLFVQTSEATGVGSPSVEINLLVNSTPPSRLNHRYMLGLKEGPAPTVAFVGSDNGTTGVNATSVVVPVPAGTQDGDLMVAFINMTNGTFSSAPAGWTHVAGSPFFLDAALDHTFVVQTRIASSEPADYTWNRSSVFSGMAGVIMTFSGASDVLDFLSVQGEYTGHNDGDTVYTGTDTGASQMYVTCMALTGAWESGAVSTLLPTTNFTETDDVSSGGVSYHIQTQYSDTVAAGAVSENMETSTGSQPTAAHHHLLMGIKGA